jgi:hypothetical protein
MTGICGRGYIFTLPPFESPQKQNACSNSREISERTDAASSMPFRHARVFSPAMFIAQLPQMPSRQERRKVRVGSISFWRSVSRNVEEIEWGKKQKKGKMKDENIERTIRLNEEKRERQRKLY